NLRYELIDVEPHDFEARLRVFLDAGGLGANVTLPHKLAAFDAADHVSSDAYRAGAVNTLALLEDGSLFGDNTDGAGLIRDLTVNHGLKIEGRRILLIGAGGAARGAMGSLMDEGPAELVVANRHPGKAMLLAQLFAETGNVHGMSLASVHGPFDLVINATSASLHGEVPALSPDILGAESFAYDMVYADAPTAFLEWARKQCIAGSADGWGMMVEQAAESFFIWRGVRPDTTALLKRN
ncbi:MAG: shikimate dehydrogenase, partial [Proteobacteria bacterium]|nr:shikimate dehydrogenase [Pseudomonadota bacterium]